ncbi:tetraacyldisaccharide 4'-kinase [Aureisphaera sp. CAU 1614]|uniref:Tetraacyldisaccharide 4'-kinase n=1 Tax=Halomarinibacterium sedimenti TaxID=2857106 RepID=A0A9X1FL02_9FLAO|nr:tetraacyldisaccharide 4'-kinase [Halomarinibacterium sedimenti]MBW2936598.1 tetraacyldisaccharide 4'-kinase [Halomarinibacterium sedimenti]
MNFRKFLFPFSILYDGVTSLRNYAYDKGWKDSTEYEIPVISVGNLSVGGTGKSPMVELLISILNEDYKVAVLSRGYKRKTSGFLEVQALSTAEEVGDEPLQFKHKFPEVTIAVCADRREGIEKLKLKAEVIILDDAFQHRKVKPALSILLTSYSNLFIEDLVLPAGNLRESKRGMERADIIVITKIPDGTAYAKLQEVQHRMQLKEHQSIYFSIIGYDDSIYGKTESLPLEYLENKAFTLVTGIANPTPLVEFLEQKNFTFQHQKFSDHHHFSTSEIEKLQKEDLILTTEKDFKRLSNRLQKRALYYLPITTVFLHKEEGAFEREVLNRIEYFRKY